MGFVSPGRSPPTTGDGPALGGQVGWRGHSLGHVQAESLMGCAAEPGLGQRVSVQGSQPVCSGPKATQSGDKSKVFCLFQSK